MPTDARAAVIKVTGQPVSLTWYSSLNFGIDSEATWDIDGDGTNEFTFKNYGGPFGYFLAVNNVYSKLLGLSVYDEAFLGGVYGLPTGASVGPTPGPFQNWLLQRNQRPVIGYWGGTGQSSGFFVNNYRGAGNNYFGFRFGSSASFNYGFAFISFSELEDYDPENPDLGSTRSFTISSWAYESEPGVAITISSLEPDPAPVPGPIGLAGLAAGAAWTRSCGAGSARRAALQAHPDQAELHPPGSMKTSCLQSSRPH